MLNPFPQLFVFSFFAPLLLRFLLTAIFAWKALRVHGHGKTEPENKIFNLITGLYLLVAIAFLIGAFTQIVSLIAIAIVLGENYILLAKKRTTAEKTIIPITVIAIALSLLISGAGAFAFDLPF